MQATGTPSKQTHCTFEHSSVTAFPNEATPTGSIIRAASWWRSLRSQSSVYLGARDLGRSDDYMKEKMPGVNVDMLDGTLAGRQHDGGHTDGPNVEHFIRWAKTQRGEKVEQEVSTKATTDRRSLKEAVGDRFQVGVGVSHAVLPSPEDAALIKQHFSILTTENCMKPQSNSSLPSCSSRFAQEVFRDEDKTAPCQPRRSR